MKSTNLIFSFNSIVFLFLILSYPAKIFSLENQNSSYNRDSLISAAKEVMIEIRFCALITLDDAGLPQVRTMDPFAPDSDMIVWFGTNKNSRKVKEIRNNSKATLYYQASGARGYVVLSGDAYLVDDPDLKLKYWKSEWKSFYPESRENYTLIKFVPVKLEIIDYKHNITGDPITWNVPNIRFK